MTSTRNIALALSTIALTLGTAGCGSSTPANPTTASFGPAKPGWTMEQTTELVTAVKNESKTPPVTTAQAECVSRYIEVKLEPTELADSESVLASDKSAIKASCGIA